MSSPDADSQSNKELGQNTYVDDGSPVMSKETSSLATPGKPMAAPYSTFRMALIIIVLCSAQFFDIFNASSAIVALPVLGSRLNFTPGALPWVISGYTLTFAAFMLASGRLADIFHPKPVFCMGYAIVGLFSIPVAASVHPIMTVVFRAVQGVGAALNIPAAISMIVTLVPDPAEQGRALAMYGASGAIGNVLGFIIGGILSARVSWRWSFYLTAIVIIPFAVLSWFILPDYKIPARIERQSVDWPGVITLTAGLILFVYAVSDGSDAGWGSARIIATLVISILLFILFFVVESIVKDPAVPLSTWSNKNFTPLFFYAWSIYWFVLASELQLVQVFTELWHKSTMYTAIHFIPIGIFGGIGSYLTGMFGPRVPRRTLLLSGQVFLGVGTVLFALANASDKYWSYVLPGMIVGMIGTGIAYVGCSIAVMEGARKGEEGVVAAIMFTAFQIGSTIGIAITSSITISVNKKQPLDAISQYLGYEASFWSMLGMHCVMIIITLIFVQN